MSLSVLATKAAEALDRTLKIEQHMRDGEPVKVALGVSMVFAKEALDAFYGELATTDLKTAGEREMRSVLGGAANRHVRDFLAGIASVQEVGSLREALRMAAVMFAEEKIPETVWAPDHEENR